MNDDERPMSTTPFDALGGEEGVRALVDRFYDLMALDERFAGIRALHPVVLDGSRDKLFWFLCGWLGGPDHFQQRFGHPRLRARHLPFPIGVDERDQWLLCMSDAMDHRGIDGPLREQLAEAFHRTADRMRNRPG